MNSAEHHCGARILWSILMTVSEITSTKIGSDFTCCSHDNINIWALKCLGFAHDYGYGSMLQKFVC